MNVTEKMNSKIKEEFSFPTADVEMAKIRFEVELSSAENIKWDATWRGLLSYFAMCSHATYLKLAEELKEKCGGSLRVYSMEPGTTSKD